MNNEVAKFVVNIKLFRLVKIQVDCKKISKHLPKLNIWVTKLWMKLIVSKYGIHKG